jgi:hypothetical protein
MTRKQYLEVHRLIENLSLVLFYPVIAAVLIPVEVLPDLVKAGFWTLLGPLFFILLQPG